MTNLVLKVDNNIKYIQICTQSQCW